MIKYLVMDIDGTLTDGKIYMGSEGEMAKAFDIKDGAGIALLLPKLGITPVIITGRESKIVANRCKELRIETVYQGVKNKLAVLKDIVDDLSTVAYAGDDLPDIPCMEEIKKSGGKVVCPSDAVAEIKAIADYISGFKAGEGAIRDCINYLSSISTTAIDIEARIKNVVDAILAGEYMDGFIDGNPYTIQEYETKEESDCVLESHHKHIDVQYIIEGREVFKMYSTSGLTATGEYNSEKDAEFWQDGIISTQSVLVPGSLIVVRAGQPHKGCIRCGTGGEKVKKLVCKIEV